MPDTIYSPSMIELNPDHRTTALLSLEIQRIVMHTDINTLIPRLSDFNPPPLAPSVISKTDLPPGEGK
ncbi:MAG: hypothetical protein Q8P40_08115, partial [Nitrospirota bacterium]|nr:hypothetical protein [Nitrospirota bacterium]